MLQGSLLASSSTCSTCSRPSGAAELAALISVVAVHKTDLFRDEVQLEAFRRHVLEPLVAQVAGRPLRVWSAGCATGEEVATLLIMLDEARRGSGQHGAGHGHLRGGAQPGADAELLRGAGAAAAGERCASATSCPMAARAMLVPELRERASFQRHNLMETPYPAAGGGEGFDIIFCRNVLIYFTPEAFDRVVALAGRAARARGHAGAVRRGAAAARPAEPADHPQRARLLLCPRAGRARAPQRRPPLPGGLPASRRPRCRAAQGAAPPVVMPPGSSDVRARAALATAAGLGRGLARQEAPGSAPTAASRADSGRFPRWEAAREPAAETRGASHRGRRAGA